MEFQKITNFLDTVFDDKDLSWFVTKKWIEVCDLSEKTYEVNKKKIELKHQCEDQIYVIILMYILF